MRNWTVIPDMFYILFYVNHMQHGVKRFIYLLTYFQWMNKTQLENMYTSDNCYCSDWESKGSWVACCRCCFWGWPKTNNNYLFLTILLLNMNLVRTSQVYSIFLHLNTRLFFLFAWIFESNEDHIAFVWFSLILIQYCQQILKVCHFYKWKFLLLCSL